jgi:hypothetical protein
LFGDRHAVEATSDFGKVRHGPDSLSEQPVRDREHVGLVYDGDLLKGGSISWGKEHV